MIIDFHTHHPAAEGVTSPRSFGIHPWHSGQWLQQHPNQPLQHLREALPPQLQLLGECGLDACCQVPLHEQMQVFTLHLLLAQQLGLPVVVHCVRCHEQLIALRRQFPHTPWVVHGFTGSPQQAQQLAAFGIGVSFGAALTHPARTKVHQALRSRLTPQGTLQPLTFLETDDSPIAIQQVHQAAAQILQIPLPQLTHAIKTNYHTLFPT